MRPQRWTFLFASVAVLLAFATFADDVPEARRWLVADAMTSGGLLVALPPGHEDAVDGAVVGRLVDGEPGAVAVR